MSRSIADHVSKDLDEAGVERVRVEGMPHGDWVLIDAGDVIVHVFRPEVRAFYNLEKMWAAAAAGDARTAELITLRSRCVIVVAAVGRLKQGPETRARRALPQARRADRPQRSACATSRSSKSAKAAPTTPASA